MDCTRSLMWKIAVAVCGIFVIAGTVTTNSARAYDVSESLLAGVEKTDTPKTLPPVSISHPTEQEGIGPTLLAFGKPASSVDKKKPKIKILGPKKNTRVLEDSALVSGTASDNSAVASVWWRVNGGVWQQASGTVQWTATVPLIPGANKVEVYSQDAVGNVSPHASLALVSLKNLLNSYWPMNDGDEKNYTGMLASMTISFAETGARSFDMNIDPADASGDSGVMHYQLGANNSQSLLTGFDYLGYSLDIEPPLVELDATLLDKGGSRKSSARVTIYDIDIPISMTVSVKNAGTVKVPAGTYQNCKQLSEAIKARVPGYGVVSVSSETYILARGVGAIKSAVFELSGTSLRLAGWESLVSGTVAGVDVTTLASAAVKQSAPVIGSPGPSVKTSEKNLPQLESQTSHALLEFTKYDDGESQLVLRGRSGHSYVIEAGALDESGERIWTPIWEGVLTEGPVCLSVPDSVAGIVYRVRER